MPVCRGRRPAAGGGGQAAARAMRRERRGGDADAESPQAFKEGARTLQNEQKGTRSVVLRRRGWLGGGDAHETLFPMDKAHWQRDDPLYPIVRL